MQSVAASEPPRRGESPTGGSRRSAPAGEHPVSLLALPESHYAVQLMALSTRGAAEDYASKHNLSGALHASIERDGRTLHILLAGIYPDRDRARQAAANMAATLPDVTPWVRQLGPLQRAVRDSAKN